MFSKRPQESNQIPLEFLSQRTGKLMKKPVSIQNVENDGSFLTIDESEIFEYDRELDLLIIELPELRQKIENFLSKQVERNNSPSNNRPKPDVCVPIYILGDTSSGKSALIKKLTTKEFDSIYKHTVSLNETSYDYPIDDSLINLKIKEIPYQSGNILWLNLRPDPSLTIIIVIDITNQNSLKTAQKLYNEAIKKFDNAPNFILVSTKNDLEINRQITEEELKTFAQDNSMAKYFQTSATDYNNGQLAVAYPFIYVAKTASERHTKSQNVSTQSELNKLILKQLTGYIKKIQDVNIKNTLLSYQNKIELDSRGYSNLLNNLESTFKGIVDSVVAGNNNNFFGSRNNQYTNQQLEDIAILKKMLILLTEHLSTDKTILADEKSTILKSVSDNKTGLIDFNRTRYELFVKETTSSREKINQITSACYGVRASNSP